MKKSVNTVLALLLGLNSFVSTGQEKPDKKHGQPYRIAFYNVENLFDTLDDPFANDSSFLPGARIPWTSERYQDKLDRLSEVMAALAADKPAAVIGLCEVENRSVLEDLVTSPSILRYLYAIIHTDGPDERGIDNALVYDPRQFTPVAYRAVPVDISAFDEDHTRDILYVKGIIPKSKADTLHIFVNHWPSRSEGKEQSEPKRMAAAAVLKHITDSLLILKTPPLILIMGDFNDEPADKSLAGTLGATEPGDRLEPGKLYNLGYSLYRQGRGTLYYKDWDLFDQILVNGTLLLKTRGLASPDREQAIFFPEWLLYKGNDGTLRPNRTAAKEYYGGYSDHLPVYLDLKILN